MGKEYEVTWTATFMTTLTLEPGEVLSDKIADINIPEEEGTSYVSDTWEVEEVRGPDGKRISERACENIVGA